MRDGHSSEEDPTAVKDDEEEESARVAVAQNDIYNRIKNKRLVRHHNKTKSEKS